MNTCTICNYTAPTATFIIVDNVALYNHSTLISTQRVLITKSPRNQTNQTLSSDATRLHVYANVDNVEQGFACILKSFSATELTYESREGFFSWFGRDELNLIWTFHGLSSVPWIESLGQFVLIRFPCYR